MKIMIAVDDSAHSERAVEFLTRVRWPGGSRVIVTSVVQPVAAAMALGYPSVEGGTIDVPAEQCRKHEAAVTRAQGALRAAGFSTEVLVVEGEPRERLMQLVESERVDLLVMGSRGRGGLARLVLGSVSNHAVNHAACAVLVVRGAGHLARAPHLIKKGGSR